jgi:hypothetical protein
MPRRNREAFEKIRSILHDPTKMRTTLVLYAALYVRLGFAALRSTLLKNGKQRLGHLLWHFKDCYLWSVALIVISDAQEVSSLALFH